MATNKIRSLDKPKPSSNKAILVFLALFGFPFAVWGTLAVYSVAKQAANVIRMQFWQQENCQILSVMLYEEPSDEQAVYCVKAEYRYDWMGKACKGTKIYAIETSMDSYKSRHERLFNELELHRIDEKLTRCWVNPNRPTEAVLFRHGNWIHVTVSTVTAIIVGSIGFGLLAIAVFSWNDDQATSFAKPLRDQPWTARTDWARSEVIYSGKKSNQYLRWLSLLILIITVPGAMISGNELMIVQDWWAAIGLIPAGITSLVYRQARQTLKHWKRFGNSTLRLETCPVVAGSESSAAIRVDRLSPSKDGYQLRLTCYETKVHTDSEGSETTTTNLFDEQRTVLKELRDNDGLLWIPILFQIPYSVSDTKLKTDGFARTWKLHVRSLTFGHGYDAEFEVPVFHTSESDRKYIPQSEASDDFITPVDPFASIKATGIVVDTSVKDIFRFTFPARRHFGFAFAMLVVQAVFAAGITVLLGFFWKPGMIPISSILLFFLAWNIVDTLLYHSEVTIESNRLSIRTGLLGLGRTRVIEKVDIKDCLLVPAGSWGSVTAYNIGVQLKSKSTVLIAKRILPSEVAKQVRQAISINNFNQHQIH